MGECRWRRALLVSAILITSFGPAHPAEAAPGDGSAYGVDVNLLGIDAGPLAPSSTGATPTNS